MTTTSIRMSGRQRLLVACIAIVPGQLVWFALLYPLIPRGAAAWAVAAGLGIVVTLWAVCSTAVIAWLNKQKQHRLLCNAVGVLVALQLGVGIFALALFHQDLLANRFSYFGR
jgi:hypothetical protein